MTNSTAISKKLFSRYSKYIEVENKLKSIFNQENIISLKHFYYSINYNFLESEYDLYNKIIITKFNRSNNLLYTWWIAVNNLEQSIEETFKHFLQDLQSTILSDKVDDKHFIL